MELKFTKMHGCGNDYVYIDCFEQQFSKEMADLAIRISDRHFGVGADGVICLFPSTVADGKMIMYNSDGSQGNMCGNGVRCIAKLLYDNGHIEKNRKQISIETKSGIKILIPSYENEKIKSLRVDMGEPIFAPKLIPLNINMLIDNTMNEIIDFPLTVDNRTYNISCVSMGNPHCVVLVENVDELKLEEIGPKFENHPFFPDRTNTEFVEILNNGSIKMRVWERGSGETLACGTGACAVCVALHKLGKIALNKETDIILRGGTLSICYTGKTVFMTGEAVTVFEGSIEL